MRQQSVTSRVRELLSGALVLVAGLTALAGTANAQTFTATDEPSLETALAMANSAGGANTIQLAGGNYSPTHTLELTSGPLTIQGPAQDPTILATPAKFSGGQIVPVGATIFAVHAMVTVTFNDIQIAGAGSSGNAIIDDSGTAIVNRSTINGVGPSLDVQNGAVASIVNTTMGDGLDVGIIDTGTLTLTNSTLTRNTNGGIDNAHGTLNLINSIVAKNNNPTSMDCTAPATTSSHSLDGDGTCHLDATPSKGNKSSTDPQLGPLVRRGGTTSADFPAATSPAIDAGDPAAGACPAIDQRNAARPDTTSTNCDMGAVETYFGTAPVLTTQDVTVGSPDASGTIATYTATWRAGSPVTGVSCSPASGSKFPVGKTTVTCSGTDSLYGASGTGTFTVTDVQGAPPVVTTSGDQTIPATDAGGAIVTFTATATGTGGSVTTTCAPASGSKFPVGSTTVTCSATDANGTGTSTLTITVTPFVPPSPPMFVVPANISANATSAAGAVVTYTAPTATDPDGPPGDAVTCTHNSGELFPIGLTNVDCQATTRKGVSGSGHFTITVVGGAAPVITVPADISVPATMPGGAQVTYTVSATDPVDGTVPVTCTPASGATFSIATTKVNCTAIDKNGNTGKNSFLVTVTQSAPPTIVVPADMKVPATANAGAKVSFTVTATDPVDGALTPVCTPASGTTFPIGTTTVNCSATDKASLSASGSFRIIVPAPTGPVISVPPFRVLGAPSKAGDPVTYTVTATDPIDKTVPVTCTPPSGATFPIGTTTVNCTATDSGGRTAAASFDVEVDPPDAPTPPDNTFALPKPKVKGGVVTLKLDLPSDGKVVATETLKQIVKGKTKYVRFSRVSAKVKSGAKKLTLKPAGAGLGLLKGLAKSKKLTVVVSVKFTPTGGKLHSEHVKVKLPGLKGP